MTKKFQYVPPTEASWVEYLYHATIEVKNGVVEIDADDTLSEMYLLNHSFVPVDQPVEVVDETEVPLGDVPVRATTTRKTRKAATAK